MDAVPELVEVVFAGVVTAEYSRELARCRCEVEEAMDALESWQSRYEAMTRNEDGSMPQNYVEMLQLLEHIRDHLRWALDPKAPF